MNEITISRVEDGNWIAQTKWDTVATVKESNKYGGCYRADLFNGIIVHAFNLASLKRMIAENLEA